MYFIYNSYAHLIFVHSLSEMTMGALRNWLMFLSVCECASHLSSVKYNQKNKNITRKCNFVIECIYFCLRCHQPILNSCLTVPRLLSFQQNGCFTYLLFGYFLYIVIIVNDLIRVLFYKSVFFR